MLYWGIWIFRPGIRTCRLGWGSWGSGVSKSHTWIKSTEKWPSPPSLPKNSWLFTAESRALRNETGGKWNNGKFLGLCFGLSLPPHSPHKNPECVTGETEARVLLSSRNWEFQDGILPFPMCSSSGPWGNLPPWLGSPWAASNSHCWETQTCWGPWWFLVLFPWTLQDFGAGPEGPGLFGASVGFP